MPPGRDEKGLFLDSPVAGEMGTKYPFIQGAMSWITDVPAFAARVADAGGLPTVALGIMDAATLDQKLGRLPEIMGGRPYAVNVVLFGREPFQGKTSGLDKETETPLCRDCRRRSLSFKRIDRMRH